MSDVVIDESNSYEIDYSKIVKELIKQGDVQEKGVIDPERLITCLRSAFYTDDKWNRHGLNQKGVRSLVQHLGAGTVTVNQVEYNKSDLIILYWGSNAAKCIDIF